MSAQKLCLCMCPFYIYLQIDHKTARCSFNEVLLELFFYYRCICCYHNRNLGYTKPTVVSYLDLCPLNAWVKLARYYQENGHVHPNKMPNHRRIDAN